MATVLPERPKRITASALLLAGGALVLVGAWGVGIDTVESNGARVFLFVVWSYLAWSVYSGGGWVRWALVAVFVVTVWGWLNAPSWALAIGATTGGEITAKALALVALGLLLNRPARTWFATVRKAATPS